MFSWTMSRAQAVKCHPVLWQCLPSPVSLCPAAMEVFSLFPLLLFYVLRNTSCFLETTESSNTWCWHADPPSCPNLGKNRSSSLPLPYTLGKWNSSLVTEQSIGMTSGSPSPGPPDCTRQLCHPFFSLSLHASVLLSFHDLAWLPATSDFG